MNDFSSREWQPQGRSIPPMSPRPVGACALLCLIALSAGCAGTREGQKWSYSRRPDSATIVVSRPSPGDCRVAVDAVDGREARFLSASREDAPPLNQGDFDWPLYLPPGTHELELDLAWISDSGSFRYAPMNSTGERHYDRTWSEGPRSQGKVTAVFESGHSYRLYAVHKKDFEVILCDITANATNSANVQKWLVPLPPLPEAVASAESKTQPPH